MKPALSLGILAITGSAAIANNAVSALNGKLAVESGNMNSESSTIAEGSVAWPIQESFGVQLDALYSDTGQRTFGYAPVDSEQFGGVGGHFIWRDSECAMLGVEAGYVFSDPVDSYELAIEGERYFKWLTVGAKLGVAGIEFDQTSPLIETDKDAFFGQFYLGAYPIDNLLISAMVENRFDNTFVSVEVEYELPVPGLSIFANAMKGANSYDQAFVGMRYYFGEEMPLKGRHRKSDPKSQLPGMVSGIATYQAEMWSQAVKMSRKQSTSSGVGASGSSGASTNTVSTGATSANGSGTGNRVSDSGDPRNPSGGTSSQTVVGSGTLTVRDVSNPQVGQGLVSNGSGTLVLGSGGVTAGSGTLIGGSGIVTGGSGNTPGTIPLGPGNSPGGSGSFSGGTLTLGGGNLQIVPDSNPGFFQFTP